MNLNLSIVIGRLVAAPTFTKGQTDKQDRVWGRIASQRTGSEEVDFIPFVCWGGTARAVAKYCGKGKILVLVGRLQTRSKVREDGTYDNYSEINAFQVTFGPDAKNVSPEKAAAPKAAMPAPAAGPDIAAQLAQALAGAGATPQVLAALLTAGAATQGATPGPLSSPPADEDNPFA